MGSATSAAISLSGTIAADDVADFDWAAHASHVLLRTPQGDWSQCAVASARIDKGDREHWDVSLSLSGEVW
uniref:hypothetical protein n=1 Tax=Olsenella uli TaxID=133926 RepID=UPI0028E64D4A|nr:hypothetical protein [Olsenella uli]